MRFIFLFWFSFHLSLAGLFAQRPQLIIDKGHAGEVFGLHFSKDGQRLYSIGSYPDKTVKCWDLASGKLLHNFNGGFDYGEFAFSPDEKELLLFTFNDITYQAELKVWDANTRELRLQTQKYHARGNAYFYRHPFLYVGDTVRCVDNPQYILPCFSNHIKISPDNQLFALQDENEKEFIRVIDTKTLQVKSKIPIGKEDLRALAFNADGQKLVYLQAGNGNQVHIWDLKLQKKVWSSPLLTDTDKALFTDIAFNSTQRQVLLYESYNKKAVILDIGNGQNWNIPAPLVDYTPDLRKIITLSSPWDKSTQEMAVWDVAERKEVYSKSYAQGEIISVAFNQNATQIAVGKSTGTIVIENLQGKTVQSLGTLIRPIKKVIPHSADKLLIATSQSIEIWNKKEGKISEIIATPEARYIIHELFYSEPFDRVLTWEYNMAAYTPSGADTTQFVYQVRCIDLKTKQILWKYSSKQNILAAISGDKRAFFLMESGQVKKIDMQTFKTMQTFSVQLTTDQESGDSLAFEMLQSMKASPDNKSLVFMGNTVGAPMISLTYLKSQKYNFDYTHSPGLITALDFQVSQNILLAGGSANFAMVNPAPLFALNLQTGKLIREFNGHQDKVWEIGFHPTESKQFVSASADNTLKIWDINQEKPLATLEGHQAGVTTLCFMDNGKYLVSGSEDGSLIFWDWQKRQVILSLFILDELGNYTLLSPDGRFDGTPEGIEKLVHFSVSNEIIEIEQLKERYYEPNLWKKLLGYTDEPLRQVPNLDKINLYPEIKLGQFDPKQGILNIELLNRGGGIGKVPVFLNGKEIFEDALSIPNVKRSTPSSSERIGVGLDLKNHPLIQPNVENVLEVKAFNAENWLVSRPQIIRFKASALQSRGTGTETDLKGEIDDSPPSLHVLCIGVSEYANSKINLKFSAKDAEDMAKALEISGRKLFELEEKNHVFINLLSSKQGDTSKKPTKKNILKTLEGLSKTVRHQDILVVYLAGHGTNYGGQDGDFYYLTQEALSLKLDDPALRNEGALASKELTEALKKIVARKQVLMIDACHSGKAVDNLMAKRDLEGSTTRALERMKDRTGLHILTGCTADAVSYEASQYGQGLLTYSLLSGIKGLALREDKYLDIVNLFQFARERVPQLAGSLGGIQEPKVFSPYGSESFDIGVLESTDKAKIPLAQAKPIFLHSTFLDADKFSDHLKLAQLLDDLLIEHSTRGESASLIFVQAQEFPNAYKVGGIYKIIGNQIQLRFAIHQGDNPQPIKQMEITGEKNDLEGLQNTLLQAIKKVINP